MLNYRNLETMINEGTISTDSCNKITQIIVNSSGFLLKCIELMSFSLIVPTIWIIGTELWGLLSKLSQHTTSGTKSKNFLNQS